MTSPPNKLPEWATGGSADITEPLLSKKQLGWVGGATPDRPPAQFFNWWQNLSYQWMEFFRNFLLLYDLNGNWVDQNSNIADNWLCHDVKYDKDADSGAGLFVAVGRTSVANRVIITSADGETWTVRENPGSGNEIIFRVAYSGDLDLWCAVGVDSGTNEWIQTAPGDGVTWTQRTAPGTDFLQAITYDPVSQLFIAVGENERIYSSTDGITWTSRNSGGSNDFLEVAVDPSGNFVAAGHTNLLATSSNGTTWTVTTSSGIPFGVWRLLFVDRMNSGSGLWVAVGVGGRLAISTTGAQGTWTEITGHGFSDTLLGFADDPKNQRLVATAADGTIYVYFGDEDPADDVAWAAVQSDTVEAIWGIAQNDLAVLSQNRYWVRGGVADSGETGGLTQIAKGANALF